MSEGTALLLALGSAILAIVYGAVSVGWVLAKPAGNDRMQEIAAAIQEGAKYLEKTYGGKGVLLSGVPGVKSGTVVVIGGGIVGCALAARTADLGLTTVLLEMEPGLARATTSRGRNRLPM